MGVWALDAKRNQAAPACERRQVQDDAARLEGGRRRPRAAAMALFGVARARHH
jgi:hypothetical protein